MLSEELVQTEERQKHTLKSGHNFYLGSKPIGEITKITFTNTAPEAFEESWYANKTDSSEIVGYRNGAEIYIVGDKIYTSSDSSYMFGVRDNLGGPLWVNLQEINGLEHLNTGYTGYFQGMFYQNPYIKKLDIAGWDLSNAVDISFMFSQCTALEELDVSRWNVGKVRDFTGLFQGNSNSGDMKFQELDVSNWDTSSATRMGHVFYGCAQLEELDVANWDVSKVKTFTHIFADCYSLRDIDVSKWNTGSVESFDAMFNDCRSFTVLDVSGLDTSTCRQFSQMFESCKNLTKIIGLENFDTSNASYYAFSEMFHNCPALKELNLSSFNTSKADNMARMFAKCTSLENLDIGHFDISNVKYFSEMFKEVDARDFILPSQMLEKI